MTDSSQPVAGWYPDPENPTAERWWDGGSWTDHRRPSTVAPPAPPVAAVVPPVPAPPAADPDAFAAPGASLAGAAPLASGAAPAAEASATVSPYSAAPAASPYGTSPDGAPGYGAPTYAPAQPSNALAVVGFVVALGGLVLNFGGLTSLAGGIVSTIALVRASRMRAQGQAGHRWGMALAGTICGYVLFVVVAAVTIAAFSYLVNGSLNDATYS